MVTRRCIDLSSDYNRIRAILTYYMAADISAAPSPADHRGPAFLPKRLRGILFVLPSVLRDPLTALLEAQRECGNIVCFRATDQPIVMFCHPDQVQHVLHERHMRYGKGAAYRFLEPVLGRGLLTTDGDEWKRLRRLVTPTFSREHRDDLLRHVAAATEAMLDRWDAKARCGETVSVRDEMFEVTLDALLRSTFSSGVENRGRELRDAFLAADSHIELTRGMNPLKVPEWVPTPKNRAFRAALRYLDTFIEDLIEARQRNLGSAPPDLLTMLLQSRDQETGEALSRRQVRDMVMALMHGGYEPLSDALTWTFYLLARHPQILNLLPSEPLTEMVCLEALRLYPPGWGFGRTAIEEDEVAGWRIPKGTLVLLSPWVTQRLPEFWEAPDTFDPYRFSPERSAGRHRFAYFPFAAGPRICIGREFALQEMGMILTRVLERFQIHVAPGEDPRPVATYGLIPDRPILMNIIRREIVACA